MFDGIDVPYADIRDSFALALAEFLSADDLKSVLVTVDDYVANHYGED